MSQNLGENKLCELFRTLKYVLDPAVIHDADLDFYSLMFRDKWLVCMIITVLVYLLFLQFCLIAHEGIPLLRTHLAKLRHLEVRLNSVDLVSGILQLLDL